ncbi:MAG: DNA translocase FtsK [Phycisphaerales bacterium]|nr:DNA translocase FtsK [Phycisphaerales bacterium]
MAQSTKKRKSGKPYKVNGRSETPSESRVLLGRVGWLALGAVWLFLFAGLVSFNAGDAPSHVVYPHNELTQNWTGPIGAHVSYGLLRLFGFGIVIPMVFALVMLVLKIAARPMTQPGIRAVGALVLTASLCTLLGVLIPNFGVVPGLSGGTIGRVGAGELVPRFAVPGTLVWVGVLTVIGLLVTCDKYLWEVPIAVWKKLAPALALTGRGAGKIAGSVAVQANSAADVASSGTRKAGGGLLGGLAGLMRKTKPVMVRVNDIDDQMVEVKPETVEEQPVRSKKPKRVVKPVPQPIERDEIEEEDEEDVVGAPQVFDREKLREKIEALPVRFAQENREMATDEDLADFQNAQSLEGYKFPTMDLLEEPEIGFNEKLEALVREQAENLEHALNQYKIDGEVVDIESGPAITLYHIRLAPGTKVSQINAIESDLARSLKAVNIRVVSNMEGRDTIGIEVPNPTKERVRLKELMSNRSRFEDMKLPMFLGKDAAGDPLISDLTKMPHMLIAGTTGSGKSVCMNTIIMSFLYTKKPNELKLVLVDPKMVEMSQFKDIPHLMCPVVTEMPKAAAILEWAVTKMDERYELLASAGVRDIAGYNELEWDELKERLDIQTEEKAARTPKSLPYMVFIIDELADLMMTNKEVEGSIIRIAQKARAVGIHLILATQRPQANVVTGLIKSNMPCRIAFKVASGMDSRIVLDQKGGELLLGQGDMLQLSPSSHKLSRAQGTLVDDKEIRRVVKFLKDIAAPSFERSLMQVKGEMGSDEERLLATENNSSASLAAAQEDPLFDRAVEIVLETKRGSVSLLQRRLAIGYTRASRLIDLMGIAGIISEHNGSQARSVMISVEEWHLMKEMAAEMEAEQRAAGVEPEESQYGTDPEDEHQTTMFIADEESSAGEESAVDEDAVGGDEVEVADSDLDEVPFEVGVNQNAVEVLGRNEDEDSEDDAYAAGEYDEDEDEDELEEELIDEVEDDQADEAEEDEDEEEYEDEEVEAVDDESDEESEDEEDVEYEYVDEDGNPIDPEDMDEDEYEVEGDAESEDDEEEDDEEYAEDEYEEEYEEEDEELAQSS